MENIQKDQSKVLFFSSFTEFGERYSYYIIQAILIFLLMDKFHITESNSSSLVGTALGMIYISAIIGGYIADKLIGYYRAAFIGSILMSIGSLLLAISHTENSLFIGLAFISISTGLIKSNMASFIGDFYDKSKLSESHRDFGFSIFYVGINAGQIFSLFLASSLKDKFGYAVPFYTSLFVLLFVIANLLIGFKKLGFYINSEKNVKNAYVKSLIIIMAYIGLVIITLRSPIMADLVIFIAIALCVFILIKSAQGNHSGKVKIVSTFFAIAILYWIIYMQLYISILVFMDKTVSHNVFGFNLTSSQFLAVESLIVVSIGSLMGKMWLYFGRIGKPIHDIDKFKIGFIFLAISYAAIYIGTIFSGIGDKVSPVFIIIGLFLFAISELSLSAMGLSMITKNAPDGYVSLYMGIWLVTIGVGAKIAGFFSSFIDITDNVAQSKSNMSHALIVFSGVCVLGIFICYVAKHLIINKNIK